MYFSPTIQQPYELITPAAESPISLAEFKLWAKVTTSADDDLIQQIIDAVTREAEAYTKLDFVSKGYRTYRDYFGDEGESPARQDYYYAGGGYYAGNYQQITLRRSPLVSVDSITYLKSGVSTAFTDFYVVKKPSFSKVLPNTDTNFPTDADNRAQAITIDFTAGFGAAADVPSDIKQALLAHATSVYQNRGDCDPASGGCSCAFAPAQSLMVYNQRRIIDFRAY